MEFDEYDYLEKTVENPEPLKMKEKDNGNDYRMGSAEKDRSRSLKHRSDEKDDGGDEHRRSKSSKSGGDDYRDHERDKERVSSRHRSRSRDGERDRHGERDRNRSSREHRDKDRDREERDGKDRDRVRDREKGRDRDTRERNHDSDRERERDKEKERERSRRSRSETERHRSERDEKFSEKSRDIEFGEREKEEPRERERGSRKYKVKKEDLAEPEVDPERDQRTVFAYQICLKADERDVYEFFSRAGKVRDVRLIMDRNSRRSKGVGYIEFYDAMSVPMAIALSGQPLLGQPVMVKPSEAEKNLVQSTAATGSGGLNGPYSGGARRLYVGNLHFNITEEQIRQIFEPFGAVELVQLPVDETGQCKGFAFVQYARLEDARNALNLNAVEIAGRAIKVTAVTDQMGTLDGGTNVGDFDDDEGGGLSLNARSRALLMQKLDRTGTASSIAGSLGTGGASTGLTLPTVQILGGVPLVPPAATPLLQNSIAALSGLPAAGIQLSAASVHTIDTIGTPSECLLLKNMFDPKAEMEPDFDLDIKEDVRDECSKFGNVKHIYVDKDSAGFVYMRFETTQAATDAQLALHGRWFAGKMITVAFMVPQTYEAKFPDSR